MPFPDSPLTLYGGCNCRSIRYKLNLPRFEERPHNVYCDPEHITSSNRLPIVVLDHCNDCRRATGALINAWILCPEAFFEVFCEEEEANVSEIKAEAPKKNSDIEREWVRYADLLGATHGWMRHYESSEGKQRGFCGKCGTSLWYISQFSPAEWPAMIDIVLGTIDRQNLETTDLTPERQLWWDCGIPWARKLIGSESLPAHPIWKMNEVVK